MSSVVVAHVPADAEAAQAACAALQHAGALSVALKDGARPLSFGAGIVLGIVWSSKAVGSEPAFLAMLAASTNPVFVVRADDAPLGAELFAQKLHVTPAHATPEDVAAAFKIARLTAGRGRRFVQTMSEPAKNAPAIAPNLTTSMERDVRSDKSIVSAAVGSAPNAKPAGYKSVFLGGMTQGLASSVAVLGLGGVITIGIQERAGVLGMSPTSAQALENATDFALVQIAGATDDVDTALYEPFEASLQHGVLEGDALAAEAAKLRAVAQAQGAQIDARLGAASDTLSVVRTQTTYVVERLEQIASAPAQTLAPISPIAFAPSRAAPAPVAAPAERETAAIAPGDAASSTSAARPTVANEQALRALQNPQPRQRASNGDGGERSMLQPASLFVGGREAAAADARAPEAGPNQKTGSAVHAFHVQYEHAKDDEANQLWTPMS